MASLYVGRFYMLTVAWNEAIFLLRSLATMFLIDFIDLCVGMINVLQRIDWGIVYGCGC